MKINYDDGDDCVCMGCIQMLDIDEVDAKIEKSMHDACMNADKSPWHE